MKPIIQIINASYDTASNDVTYDKNNYEREELPFDISDPDDGLRAKFLEGLHYDSVSAGQNIGQSSLNSSLFHRAHVKILPHPQFTTSKHPNGKDDPSTVVAGGGGWFSSINVEREGLLSDGWMEKHSTADALPSVVLILASATEDRTGITGGEASSVVEQTRSVMANKRPTMIHIVCLVKSYKSSSGGGGGGAVERGEKILRQHRDAALQERICSECRLPTNNVCVLREDDLEQDVWEERVVNSPYAASAAVNNNQKNARGKIMSVALRNLTSTLLRSSASYYSQLAEHAERKLTLWRNRYHTTNASFEVNTLVCVLRCGRYAFKSGLFRELENNTGESIGGGAANGGMRHYEEAYRWIMELHRRVHQWKSSSTAVPMTPGGTHNSPNEFSSPKVTQSPGGGIGVELSLPPTADVPPPPQETPGLTSKRGSFSAENVSFYSSLYQQSRSVAAIINIKMMTCQNTMKDLETTWRRHRIAFLGNYDSEALYGPMWHKIQYYYEQVQQYAIASESLWRKDATLDPRSLDSSYFSAAAPWGIFGELAEVVMRLGEEVKKIMDNRSWKDPRDELEERKKYFGSVCDWKLVFEKESKRNHSELALEYTLHALALVKENDTICRSISDSETESTSVNTKFTAPNGAVRLHYLAGRLLASKNDPANALPHLRIAARKTNKRSSMHLTIQRALLHCERKCSSNDHRETFMKLFLDPNSCSILSSNEIAQTPKNERASCESNDIVWRDDDSGVVKPPLDFAVTFLNSTHATSSDAVLACVSVKSCLNARVDIESIQLNTTAGQFEIENLQQYVDRETLQCWIKGVEQKKESRTDVSITDKSIQLESKGLVYFFTELKLPASLDETVHGKAAADLTKFIPKNGKLCNMGFTIAAGNICKSRWRDESNRKITQDGKPVPVPNLANNEVTFFGGVPFVCHGLSIELKPSNRDSTLPTKLHIERMHLLSPLGRSDALQYLMEECNYMSHSWSRPAYHPWCLGPRCLRVLSPRPHMEVSNLTEPATGGEAIEGTVNRIVFQLSANENYECRDITLRLRCSSRSEDVSESGVDSEGESKETKMNRTFLFVQKSQDSRAVITTEEGVILPIGWEPRRDVIKVESQDTPSVVVPYLEGGKSVLLPLDLFSPLSISSEDASESDEVSSSTAYEIILTFEEVRTDEGGVSSQSGNQVMVIHRGTMNWIKPFSGTFSVINGHQKSFPGGIQHDSNVSNMRLSSSSRIESQSDEIISADGERIRMRFVLKTNGLGGNAAANVESIVNEAENNEKLKQLYSFDESAFLQSKQGAKLSTSYCVITQRNSFHSNEYVTLPLGVISVKWKPTCLSLSCNNPITIVDEFDMAHGPLSISTVTPMIFYGPRCQVLNAPFSAKILKHPSPKVGIPFRVVYQITNNTAKIQVLTFSLDDASANGEDSSTQTNQLLISGWTRGEVQISPFEMRLFPFTFMSMVAGNVPRPNFTVSSGRHQSWVINEKRGEFFFVMP